MTARLRPGSPADTAAVVALIAGAAAHAFESVGTPDQLAAWLDGLGSPSAVAARLGAAHIHVLVAERADGLAGTAAVNFNPVAPDGVTIPAGWVELGSMYCAERGAGVGGALLAEAVAVAVRGGAGGVYLSTAPTNKRMRRRAERHGFGALGRYLDDRFFIGAPFDVFGLPLSR